MKEKDTAAQDILLELSAEAAPNNDHRHPPTSISFGQGKRNLRQQQQQQQQQRMAKKVQASEDGATNSKPVLLAPSRRDMTSLRIRKMVSEESAVLEGGATKNVNNAASKTATTTNHRSSPMIDDNTPSRKTSMLGGGLFPRTTPQRDRGAIVAPEQHRSSPTHSVDSASQASQISELKASISELKNAGVGGVNDESADIGQLYKSLVKITSLSQDIKPCPAHDYWQSNLDFALSILPNDQQFKYYRENIKNP